MVLPSGWLLTINLKERTYVFTYTKCNDCCICSCDQDDFFVNYDLAYDQ